MRAFVIEAFGTPGTVREVPDPTPEAGEVLVRVRAGGVNPFDSAVVNGYLAKMMEHRFPLVPGSELSGEVVSAPEGSGFAAGDAVYGSVTKPFLGAGAWAELATTPAGSLAPRPGSLSDAEASTIPIAGLTALAAVDGMGLGDGQTLLVIGATGGVGSYAVQLAAGRGVQVVAVSRGANADLAKELGASRTIDYTQGDVAEQVRAAYPDGVDGLLDTFDDAETVTRLAAVVRRGGVVASPKGGANGEALAALGLRVAEANQAPLKRLAELNERFASGALRPPPVKAYPLERTAEALAEVAGSHVRGKLAITIE